MQTVKKSKTRTQMELAATYIARSELGVGLDPKKVEEALFALRNWKKWFTHYMIGKEDRQAIQAHVERFGVRPNPAPILTDKTARELADNIFRSYYDAEVRALSEPTLSPYWTREIGNIELMQMTEEEEFFCRSLREFVPEPGLAGEFYDFNDAGNARKPNLFSLLEEDENVIENEYGFFQKRDFSEEEEKYQELKDLIMSGKFSNGKILVKAKTMAVMKIITWHQYKLLRIFAVGSLRINRK